MENEAVEVEDNDWGSHDTTKEQRKKRADETWEALKRDWVKTEEEPYENTISGTWVQRGPYLVNKSAKLEFATYIGVNKRLVGIDANGKPVLEDIH
jgi:hypothetical protein